MGKYDVAIIGGGLGGLACGTILSKEGMSVCVLEKNRRIGGCLQSFKRGEYILDTGMHYVGSLAEGQTMYQYFKYFGILDSLDMQKMEESGYDVIHFGDERYVHAMGYGRFLETLVSYFPEEEKSIKDYCNIIKKIGSLVSPETLREGKLSAGGMEYLCMPAYGTLCNLTDNKKLINVLSATIGLYAADPQKTSLYVHGMTNHSNIEGSYAFRSGSQQLADALAWQIIANGGKISCGCKIKAIHVNGHKAEYIENENGEKIEADYIISSLHPAYTMSLIENNTIIKKAFIHRIESLENSFGVFTAYLLLKHDSVKYTGQNHYLLRQQNIWSTSIGGDRYYIPGLFISMQPKSGSPYTDVITIMTPMDFKRVAEWEHTSTGHRGEDYEEFKALYAEKMIDYACRHIPEIKNNIERVETSTPLTYRDFTATPQGCAYGIVKNYHNPWSSYIPARTKIPNLLLTGQSLNMHGCLGVSISAAVTCAELTGTSYLAKKISEA